MSEGEVAVSLAGIATPLVIGALAGTVATWRLAFVIGAAVVGLAVLAVLGARGAPSAETVIHMLRRRPARLDPNAQVGDRNGMQLIVLVVIDAPTPVT
jgi:hypothetical protein